MTRKEYLELKKEQKESASQIRSIKDLIRKGWMTRGVVKDRIHHEFLQLKCIGKSYQFRTKHIFLCLCRGRSRVQIENNFNEPNIGDWYTIEQGIQKLCTQYNLKIDLDEKSRVLSVERPWVSQAVA